MSDSGPKDWVIKQVEEHGLTELVFALLIVFGVVSAIGYFIGWRMALRRTQGEIEKVKAEARKAAGENLEKLATLRQVSNNRRETLNLAMGNLRDALSETPRQPKKLRLCRDEMCNLYESSYLPAFSEYVEMIPTLVDKRECFHRAKTELVPSLQTMCSFLEMANLAALMDVIPNSSKLLIRRESRDGVFDRVFALVPWYRCGVNRRLRGLRKRSEIHLRK